MKKETKFKGFDVFKQKIEAESFECKSCPNTCSVNMVKLQKGQRLFMGDRCEKFSGKKTDAGKNVTDYFALREKIFNSYVVTDKHKKNNFGFLRAMNNLEYLPLYTKFFSELGLGTIISDATNPAIVSKGLTSSVAETCFPVKIALGHFNNLVSQKPDYIFLPCVSQIHKDDDFVNSFGCPWTQALPYFINSSFNIKSGSDWIEYQGIKIFEPKLRYDYGMEKELNNMGILLRKIDISISKKTIAAATKKAIQHYQDFCDEIRRTGKKILDDLKYEKIFVLISRPYNGYDAGANMGIGRIFSKIGIHCLPMDFIEYADEKLPSEISTMYWARGQKNIKLAYKISRLYEEDVPWLELQIDEHSAEAGVVTRIEAFYDSLKTMRLKSRGLNLNLVYLTNFGCGPDSFILKYIERAMNKKSSVSDVGYSSIKGKVILIPPMGDRAYLITALMESLMGSKGGIVMETDKKCIRLGRANSSDQECVPYVLTLGAELKYIEMIEKGELKFNGEVLTLDDVAFFMATAQGPCRFGQYILNQKKVLEDKGYGNVQLFSLDGNKNYEGYGKDFYKRGWESMVVGDNLYKIKLLLRPLEVNTGEVNELYNKQLFELTEVIKNNGDIYRYSEKAAKAFSEIEVRELDIPTVGILGEIYLRFDDFINENIVKTLEEAGVRAIVAPISNWLYLCTMIKEAEDIAAGDRLSAIGNKVQMAVQKYIFKKLTAPYKKYFKPPLWCDDADFKELIQSGGNFVDKSFRGEAILSVGEIMAFQKHGFSGAVSVMPFKCMPGTVVDAVINSLEKDHSFYPMLSLSYDGTEQANRMNKIRTFVHQVKKYWQKKG